MKKSKKGMSAIAWIIILLILIVLGVGIYFLLSGDGTSILSGTSIPSPPPLPN